MRGRSPPLASQPLHLWVVSRPTRGTRRGKNLRAAAHLYVPAAHRVWVAFAHGKATNSHMPPDGILLYLLVLVFSKNVPNLPTPPHPSRRPPPGPLGPFVRLICEIGAFCPDRLRIVRSPGAAADVFLWDSCVQFPRAAECGIKGGIETKKDKIACVEKKRI